MLHKKKLSAIVSLSAGINLMTEHISNTMKMTLNTSQVAHQLFADKNAGWTWAGAMALAEYLEQYEAASNTEMELDVVAIRCDYSEYASLMDWAECYFGAGKVPDELHNDETIREHIQDNGEIVEFDGGVIVSSF